MIPNCELPPFYPFLKPLHKSNHLLLRFLLSDFCLAVFLRVKSVFKESSYFLVPFVHWDSISKIHDYTQQEDLTPGDRIFPICYSTARALIKNLGGRVSVVLTPRDFRRYSATLIPLKICALSPILSSFRRQKAEFLPALLFA